MLAICHKEETITPKGCPESDHLLLAMTDHLLAVIDRAFWEYPLRGRKTAELRWTIIDAAFVRAKEALNIYIDLGFDEIIEVGAFKLEARYANKDGDPSKVKEYCLNYIEKYRNSIGRAL